ncbi:hypothetical protein [Arthrobacter sp.]|uniref:hypothetical protein n=1 Tax=Arthrobacter sp. TaxID=1667 RepID=UPI002811E8D4|nr:hypothetical protein [Arthrobacter sp.]
MIRSETFRMSRGWSLPILLLTALAMNVLAAYGTSTTMDAAGFAAPGGSEKATAALVGLGFGASLFSMIFGIICVTRDFGNSSIGRSSFLSGGPLRLLSLRAFALLIPAIAFAVAGTLSVVVVAIVTISSNGGEFILDGDGQATFAGVFFTIIFAAYLGQFIAWQGRKSLPVVIALIAWTLVLEPNVINLLPAVGKFLPGGAGQAMSLDASATYDMLPVGGGYAVYLGWLVVLYAAAALRLKRSDLL